jgi:hypothetical protein
MVLEQKTNTGAKKPKSEVAEKKNNLLVVLQWVYIQIFNRAKTCSSSSSQERTSLK